MTTALDTIKGAMRLCGVLAAGEAPSGEEGSDGLSVLNAMLAGFPADGIEYVHTSISTLSGNLPLPDQYHEHVKYMLAKRIAAEYGAVLTPDVMEMAENAKRSLQAFYSLAQTAPVDKALRPVIYGGLTVDEWENG